MMNDPGIAFLKVVEYTKPYLATRSLAGMMMTAGHIAFAILIFRILRTSSVSLVGPTLFTTIRGEMRQAAARP